MTEFETTVPVEDDFLRDVDPEEKERRRLAYEEAVAEAAAFRARRREATAAGSFVDRA